MTVNKVEIKSRDFWIKVVEMLQHIAAITDQHIEETKAALRELGLDDDVKTI